MVSPAIIPFREHKSEAIKFGVAINLCSNLLKQLNSSMLFV